MGSYRSPGSDPRLEEKEDMIRLNNKLAVYVAKVRQLGAGGPDSVIFLETLRNIEDEVRKLKDMYEKELEKYRQKLEEANRQKNDALSENAQNKRVAADFQDRFRIENDKNNRMRDELNKLQQKIAELERELSTARSAAKAPQAQLSQLTCDLNREQAKNRDLARDLDQEKAKNKTLEDKNKDLLQKVDFSDKLKDEQLKDANAHLEQAKRLLNSMEAKNQDLERQIPKIMEELRKKTEKELQDYKNDMENANKQKNEAIRKQLDEQNRAIEQLRADNAKLVKENQELLNKLRALEGQIQDLKTQKACLEDQIQKERCKSTEQLRALERKLKELQDSLLQKMQEVNASRETQVTLRNEIEAYRVLLEEEERRLGGHGAGAGTGLNPVKPASASGRRASASGNRGSANGCKTGAGYDRSSASKTCGKNAKKFGPETEYQDAYSSRYYSLKRYHYGDEGLASKSADNLSWAKTNKGGNADRSQYMTGRRNSSQGKIRMM